MLMKQIKKEKPILESRPNLTPIGDAWKREDVVFNIFILCMFILCGVVVLFF